ncbi:hypothetical protein GCM10010517_01270 [Streptosporangium fragile]|uniref:Uncharacterized protein n=1 Tax=Streptosporangium fragile TaxID=46186 RepID=A0ABP6I4S5_9ACTN
MDAFFDLTDAVITVRNLIRRTWHTHHWDARPHADLPRLDFIDGMEIAEDRVIWWGSGGLSGASRRRKTGTDPDARL